MVASYQRKCNDCSKYYRPLKNGGNMYCEECQQKKKWFVDRQRKKPENRNGNNGHTPKDQLKKPDVVVTYTDDEIKKKMKENFQEQCRLRNKVLSLSHQYSKYNNMLLGWNKGEVEAEEKVKYEDAH